MNLRPGALVQVSAPRSPGEIVTPGAQKKQVAGMAVGGEPLWAFPQKNQGWEQILKQTNKAPCVSVVGLGTGPAVSGWKEACRSCLWETPVRGRGQDWP
jgi:hypothetical protein